MKTTQKDTLKAVTGMNEIPFVSKGIATEMDGFVISEDGLTRIAEALENTAAVNAGLTETQSQLEAANNQLATATENLNTRTTELETANARIQELEARVEELENNGEVTQTVKTADKGGKGTKVPFHLSGNNPANQIADSLFGKPKQAQANS